MEVLPQVLLLLGLAVAVTAVFQRLRIPISLGYLLVGVVLGPYTVGPVIDLSLIQRLAEFGIVFLLFTIGLSLSVPQLQTMRRRVLLLGTGQVVITTVVVGLVAWWLGLAPPPRSSSVPSSPSPPRPSSGASWRSRERSTTGTAGWAWPCRCSRTSRPCRSWC
jgi:Kef-type K+ transport system membrane component KefB